MKPKSPAEIRISVIIPNYCHAPYLKERIDSVLSQTRQDFEVIILDDCSTDHSREVIEKYRNHPKISHIIYNERNTGSPFKQWLKGFELAAGEYIWIAESDDVAAPDLLENLARGLDENPNVVLSFSDCAYIDKESKFIKNSHLKKYLQCNTEPIRYFTSQEFIPKILLQNCVINASMALFRKSMLPKNRYYTEFRYAGDWVFWFEIARQGDVLFVNKVLNYFRQHGANTTIKSQKRGENYQEFFKIQEYFLSQIELSKPSYYFYLGYLHKIVRRNGINTTSIDGSVLRQHPIFSIIWYRILRTLGIYRIKNYSE